MISVVFVVGCDQLRGVKLALCSVYCSHIKEHYGVFLPSMPIQDVGRIFFCLKLCKCLFEPYFFLMFFLSRFLFCPY